MQNIQPFSEFEQKFHSLFKALIDVLTFCLRTPWPASLHSTEVGNFMLTLNTRCAGLDSTNYKIIINNNYQILIN